MDDGPFEGAVGDLVLGGPMTRLGVTGRGLNSRDTTEPSRVLDRSPTLRRGASGPRRAAASGACRRDARTMRLRRRRRIAQRGRARSKRWTSEGQRHAQSTASTGADSARAWGTLRLNVTETAERIGRECGTPARVLNGRAGMPANTALAFEAVGRRTARHLTRARPARAG